MNIFFEFFTQSIVNHMYWVAISSKTEIEKEEKWTSLTNHFVNIHDHSGNKVFRKCAHEVIEREWLKLGKVCQLLFHNNGPGLKLRRSASECSIKSVFFVIIYRFSRSQEIERVYQSTKADYCSTKALQLPIKRQV